MVCSHAFTLRLSSSPEQRSFFPPGKSAIILAIHQVLALGNGRLHSDWFIAFDAQNTTMINEEIKYNSFGPRT